MPELFLIDHKLQDMRFVNKLDGSSKLQLTKSINFSVEFIKGNTQCVVKLNQSVKDVRKDGDHKFFVSVEVLGVFEVSGSVTEEDKKDIHVQAYQMLFPYAEGPVLQMCAAGSMTNFELPRYRIDRNKVSVES